MIRRALSALAIIALACALFAGSSHAARVVGWVTDQSNNAVPLATVTLYANGKLVDVTGNPVVTDANGFYRFSGLAPGDYSLQAAGNFYTTTQTASLGPGDYRLDFTLPATTAELSTTPAAIVEWARPPVTESVTMRAA